MLRLSTTYNSQTAIACRGLQRRICYCRDLNIYADVTISAAKFLYPGSTMTQTGKKSPLRLSRRGFVSAAGASLLAGLPTAHATAQLQLDGIYSEPWLLKTSGNLGDDFGAAAREKKN